MSDYTPTTEDIAGIYCSTGDYDRDQERVAQWDSWLAEVIRKAKHEAWYDGFTAGWQECDDPEAFVNSVWDAKTPNPYRL